MDFLKLSCCFGRLGFAVCPDWFCVFFESGIRLRLLGMCDCGVSGSEAAGAICVCLGLVKHYRLNWPVVFAFFTY